MNNLKLIQEPKSKETTWNLFFETSKSCWDYNKEEGVGSKHQAVWELKTRVASEKYTLIFKGGLLHACLPMV